jgi:hypothetical protein
MKITETKLVDIIREEAHKLLEDRCSIRAEKEYGDDYPSAYAGGAIRRCRDGKIWKTEALDDLEEAYTEDGEQACSECLREYIEKHFDTLTEAKYQGREVPLGKPMKGDVKKSKVYVRDPSTGNIKKVNFGDKKMRIKKSNPGRRKNFRARHNCDNPGPKTKARYWSCRAW